jgi:hypothetical protein
MFDQIGGVHCTLAAEADNASKVKINDDSQRWKIEWGVGNDGVLVRNWVVVIDVQDWEFLRRTRTRQCRRIKRNRSGRRGSSGRRGRRGRRGRSGRRVKRGRRGRMDGTSRKGGSSRKETFFGMFLSIKLISKSIRFK